MYKFRLHGLVADLWPLIRIMQMIGFFLLDYHEDMSFGWTSIRAGYAGSISGLMVIQFALMAINLMKQADDVNDLTANTITVLFFLHSLTKYFYFALRRGKFYRTLATWNNANSHPLFSENHSRHHATAVGSMRRLVIYVTSATVVSGFAWTIITFIGESVHETPDPENANETILEEVPRLMLRSWYPWNALSGGGYIVSFIIQVRLQRQLTQVTLQFAPENITAIVLPNSLTVSVSGAIKPTVWQNMFCFINPTSAKSRKLLYMSACGVCSHFILSTERKKIFRKLIPAFEFLVCC